MNTTHILIQSLLIAACLSTVMVPTAQGDDGWTAVPSYNNPYYDPNTARRSIGEPGHHSQGLPQSERGSGTTTSPPPPPPRRRQGDAWSENWGTYPNRWQGNPYQGNWDPWYVRERERQRKTEAQRRRELNKAMEDASSNQ